MAGCIATAVDMSFVAEMTKLLPDRQIWRVDLWMQVG